MGVKRLSSDTQIYLVASASTWLQAARSYFDTRREGIYHADPIDCCIAQIAIENNVLLLHRYRDFEQVARLRNLHQEYFP